MNAELLSNLVVTRVNSVSTLYSKKNAAAERKNRPLYAVVIKYEGETLYKSNGKQFLSDIEHIVLLPKGCSYNWKCVKAGHFSVIEFEGEPFFNEPLLFPVKNGKEFLKMFKDLEYKNNSENPTSALESIRDTYSILLLLMQSSCEQYVPTEHQKKLAPIMEYIFRHYNGGENITNDTLASVMGFSTVYFRKLFKLVMGVSPIAYVHRLRIEKAKEMLLSDYGSLSDIAQSLGYNNLYDFSRDFKKHTGISPSRYNREINQNDTPM